MFQTVTPHGVGGYRANKIEAEQEQNESNVAKAE